MNNGLVRDTAEVIERQLPPGERVCHKVHLFPSLPDRTCFKRGGCENLRFLGNGGKDPDWT